MVPLFVARGAAAFPVLEQIGHRRGMHELVLVAFDR